MEMCILAVFLCDGVIKKYDFRNCNALHTFDAKDVVGWARRL